MDSQEETRFSLVDIIYSNIVLGLLSLIGICIWQWGSAFTYIKSIFSIEHFWVHMALGIIVGIVLTAMVVVLHRWLNIKMLENKYIKMLKELIKQPYGPIVIGVFPGIFEELLFRGFLMPLAMSWFGVVWGVVIVSILFFALHLPQYHNNLPVNMIVLSVSFVLAILFLYTETLWAPILTHTIYNFTFSLFIKRGKNHFYV